MVLELLGAFEVSRYHSLQLIARSIARAVDVLVHLCPYQVSQLWVLLVCIYILYQLAAVTVVNAVVSSYTMQWHTISL